MTTLPVSIQLPGMNNCTFTIQLSTQELLDVLARSGAAATPSAASDSDQISGTIVSERQAGSLASDPQTVGRPHNFGSTRDIANANSNVHRAPMEDAPQVGYELPEGADSLNGSASVVPIGSIPNLSIRKQTSHSANHLHLQDNSLEQMDLELMDVEPEERLEDTSRQAQPPGTQGTHVTDQDKPPSPRAAPSLPRAASCPELSSLDSFEFDMDELTQTLIETVNSTACDQTRCDQTNTWEHVTGSQTSSIPQTSSMPALILSTTAGCDGCANSTRESGSRRNTSSPAPNNGSSRPKSIYKARKTGVKQARSVVCDQSIPGVSNVFQCNYCNGLRSSTASGRVRLRCKCGGRYRDGVFRMHAQWTRKAVTLE